MLRPLGPYALASLVASAGVIALTSGAGTAGESHGSGPVGPPPATAPDASADAAHASPAVASGEHAAPIHNYRRLSDRLLRGAQPAGDEDFAFLAAQGVKTVVSVDGARPDLARAKRHGLRYVHVPIGYDGIPLEKAAALQKAFRTLEGPFFVHCHHGKHRGPAACAIGRLVVDGVTPDQAVAEMREAGTDPRYRGLYAVPVVHRAATEDELAAVGPLPETAPVPGFQAAMVDVDERWERMKAVKKAGWRTPADHPDVDPAHEATMLAELLRELARRPEVASRPATFLDSLRTSEKAAWELSAALHRQAPADAARAYDQVSQACSSCHAAHRDNK